MELPDPHVALYSVKSRGSWLKEEEERCSREATASSVLLLALWTSWRGSRRFEIWQDGLLQQVLQDLHYYYGCDGAVIMKFSWSECFGHWDYCCSFPEGGYCGGSLELQ